MRLFGPTQEDIWKLLSEDINGNFICEGNFFKTCKVTKDFHEWKICLETYNSGSKAEPIFTMVYAKFTNKHNLKFFIFDNYFHCYFSSFFRMVDLKVPFKDFNDKFVSRANSETALNVFLDNENLRNLFLLHSDISFEVTNTSEYYNEHENTVCIKLPGIIKNNEILKNMFELIGESLLQLDKINISFESLIANEFSTFDVIKNSATNVFMEKFPNKDVKQGIINGFKEVKDFFSLSVEEKPEELQPPSFEPIVKKLPEINKTEDTKQIEKINQEEEINQNTEPEPLELSSEDYDKIISKYKEVNSKSEDRNYGYKPKAIKTTEMSKNNSSYVNTDSLNVDNLSVDMSKLKVDMSNLHVDTSNLKVDMSNLEKKREKNK